MNIAIDISPLSDTRVLSHRVRGTGFYISYLQKSLEKYYPSNSYTYFTRGNKIPDTIDIVHVPYFEPFFLTLPFQHEKKTVVTVHDLTPLVFQKEFPHGIKGGIKWQIQKRRLKKADAIITDSTASKKDICRFTGISEENVTVVPLAAGEEFKKIENEEVRIEKLRKKYSLPEKFALYVGDATWNKNLPRLIDAVTSVNIPLIMVGKTLTEANYDYTNPWNKDLVYVQQKLNTNSSLKALGFIPTDDLVTLYNCATVFLMPSLYEGFGLPLLEAMSCGCPVVTTKEGSLKEVAGDAAYFVDAYDAISIASGVARVFEERSLQKELLQNGLKQAAKFTWEKTASETTAVYESLIHPL